MVQSLACDLWRESAWQSWLLDISCCGHGYKLFDVIQPMTFGDVICQIYTSKYTTLLHMMTIYIYFHREGWPLPQTELVVWLLDDLVEWLQEVRLQHVKAKVEGNLRGKGRSDCSMKPQKKCWFMYCLMAVTFICSLISNMTIFNLIHRTLNNCIPYVASCQWHCTLLTVQRPYFSQWCRSALTPWVPMFSNQCHQVEPTSSPTNLNLTVFPNAVFLFKRPNSPLLIPPPSPPQDS